MSLSRKILAFFLALSLSGLGNPVYSAPADSKEKGSASGKDEEALDSRSSMMRNQPMGPKFSVDVLGEVKSPGTYRLGPGQKLLEALELAEGITETGSERQIELRRRGTVRKLDIFELKRKGILSNNPFLQEGDVVFVPVRGGVVSIQGPVKTPGVYEIMDRPTLQDLVSTYGNGFSAGVATDLPIRVIRFNEKNEQTIADVKNSKADLERFVVENGDTIVVPHKLTAKQNFDYNLRSLPQDTIFIPAYDDRVFVLGGVRAPGPLPFSPKSTLMNYISSAGGIARLGHGDDITVYSSSGQKRYQTNLQDPRPLNPGETIDVRESKLGPEFWITFMTTLVSLGLSAVAILRP